MKSISKCDQEFEKYLIALQESDESKALIVEKDDAGKYKSYLTQIAHSAWCAAWDAAIIEKC